MESGEVEREEVRPHGVSLPRAPSRKVRALLTPQHEPSSFLKTQEQGRSEAVKKAFTGKRDRRSSTRTSGVAAGEPVASSRKDARLWQEEDTIVVRQVRVKCRLLRGFVCATGGERSPPSRLQELELTSVYPFESSIEEQKSLAR